MITGEKVVSTDLEAKTVQVLDDTIQNICHLPPVQRHIKRYELLIDWGSIVVFRLYPQRLAGEISGVVGQLSSIRIELTRKGGINPW